MKLSDKDYEKLAEAIVDTYSIESLVQNETERIVSRLEQMEYKELITAIEDNGLDFNEILNLTECSICHSAIRIKDAHLHQGKLIGDECCWDDRLKASE